MKRPLLALLVLAALGALGPRARADDEPRTPAAILKAGTDALAGERPNEAIAELETLNDRGVTDPVVSFDRGLAYAARVRAGSEQPGDLGRAAHGFEEAKELTHDMRLGKDAATALAAVRSEIARRRARAGDPVQIEHGFSLGRAIVDVLPENAWAGIAGLMAIILTIAILLRRLAVQPRAKVAATTTAAVAGLLLVVGAGLTYAARDARRNLREGILVVSNARLLDAKHLPRDGADPLPEGLRVRIVDEDNGYSRIAFAGGDGVIPTTSVLPLAR